MLWPLTSCVCVSSVCSQLWSRCSRVESCRLTSSTLLTRASGDFFYWVKSTTCTLEIRSSHWSPCVFKVASQDGDGLLHHWLLPGTLSVHFLLSLRGCSSSCCHLLLNVEDFTFYSCLFFEISKILSVCIYTYMYFYHLVHLHVFAVVCSRTSCWLEVSLKCWTRSCFTLVRWPLVSGGWIPTNRSKHAIQNNSALELKSFYMSI